ncbi:MAG: S1 RNA-binding domain-containing protein [Planctomycetota bacterium]
MTLDPDLVPLLRRALRRTRSGHLRLDGASGEDGAAEAGGARGLHTLEVRTGTVVGVDGRDVFVEFGPRFQGVWRIAEGDAAPREGERRPFTLRGTEEGLWVLELPGARPIESWRSMRVGALVEARVIAPHPFGLELRVGELHAFMPYSQLGLGRRIDPRGLVGHRMTCEVLAVESHRQRIVLSRRLATSRERERGLKLGDVAVGRIVSGRVARLVPYGAFVDLGPKLRGLVHVRDVAHDRIGHPSERVELGQVVEVLVLGVERGGPHISLGLKPRAGPARGAAFAPRRPSGPDRAFARSDAEGRVVRPAGTRACVGARVRFGGLDPRAKELATGATRAVRLVASTRCRWSTFRRRPSTVVPSCSRTRWSPTSPAPTATSVTGRLAQLIGRALRAGGSM